SLRFYDKPIREWLRKKALVKKINSKVKLSESQKKIIQVGDK
ncbi:MAG: hypothetical protein JWP78_2181, partial [Mucilaginibacter sp.]|nr:hypothetical protein [Mucilaginibacter sp.]